LQIAQKEFGYLSDEVMKLVAQRLELPESAVLNTATFYTMLYKEPKGKYHIQVCTNVSCYLNGSDMIVDAVSKKLGIKMGETTDDGMFTLEGVQCLAACGNAPAMQINEDYYENLTPEKVIAVIEELQKKGGER
jgi:NADH-quinone oxidoreductase subunit E